MSNWKLCFCFVSNITLLSILNLRSEALLLPKSFEYIFSSSVEKNDILNIFEFLSISGLVISIYLKSINYIMDITVD